VSLIEAETRERNYSAAADMLQTARGAAHRPERWLSPESGLRDAD